ncbi:MAG: hypothetical protein ABIV36_21645 [Sphingobium limneticum]
MAWKLEGAIFVDGDAGLAYSVSLYAKGELNGEVVIQRKGPLTEAQAAELGFDLTEVLDGLNAQALASLDFARAHSAAKDAQIITLEGALAGMTEQRGGLTSQLADAVAQLSALEQNLAQAQSDAAARIAELEAQLAEALAPAPVKG